MPGIFSRGQSGSLVVVRNLAPWHAQTTTPGCRDREETGQRYPRGRRPPRLPDRRRGAGGLGLGLAEDAQAFHDVIADSHPGPVDSENPAFRPLLEKGLATALERAKTAHSYEAWYFALQQYAASFDDGHLALTDYQPMGHVWRAAWPGFLTSDRDGLDTVVFNRDPAAPPVGATLVSCDGRSAEAYAAEFVGKGVGRWNLRSRRQLFSSRLFVDQANPYVRARGALRVQGRGCRTDLRPGLGATCPTPCATRASRRALPTLQDADRTARFRPAGLLDRPGQLRVRRQEPRGPGPDRPAIGGRGPGQRPARQQRRGLRPARQQWRLVRLDQRLGQRPVGRGVGQPARAALERRRLPPPRPISTRWSP